MKLLGNNPFFKKPSRASGRKSGAAAPQASGAASRVAPEAQAEAQSEAKGKVARPQARTAGVEGARPENPAAAGARKDSGRRSSRPLLDPHGIYGTRTAGRLRAAQRRRTMQTLLLFAALIGLGFSLVTWVRARHVLRVSSRWTRALMAVPSAPPILVAPAGNSATTTGATLLAPTEEGLLLAIDTTTGAAKTSFTTAFPLRAQPLAVGDTVFVASSDGELCAVEWRSGRRLWTRRTSAGFSTRPAFARLFLPARARSTNAPTASGASSATPQAPSVSSPREIAPGARGSSGGGAQVRGVVFAGNDSGEIVAVTAADGKLLWRFDAKAPIGSGICVTSDTGAARRGAPGSNSVAGISTRGPGSQGARVLLPLMGGVGSSGGVLCLDARNGRALWRKDLGAACLPAPVVEEGTAPVTARSVAARSGSKRATASPASGHVYCCTDNGAVLCLDLATGRKIWKVFVSPLHEEAAAGTSAARQSPETSEHGEADKGARATRSEGGDDVQSGAKANGAPAFSENGGADDDANGAIALRGGILLHTETSGKRLVMGGLDGGVRCLDARNGAVLWNFDARFAVRCRPAALRLNANGRAQMDNGFDDDSTRGNAGASSTAGADTGRDLILVGSDGPVVYALEARSGALAWQFATRGPAFYTPFLHNQELIALTGQGYAQNFPLPR